MDEYRLDRISDLLTIPIDKLEFCLRDLQYAVMMAHLIAGEEGPPHMDSLVWRDDNNHSVRCTANGKPLLTLEVTGDDNGSR